MSYQNLAISKGKPNSNNSLGDVFAAYIYTVRPNACREPLKARLIADDGELIWGDVDAIILLKQIEDRIDDGVEYYAGDFDTSNPPACIDIFASCSQHWWWNGEEQKPFDERYDEERGFFDLTPHSPFKHPTEFHINEYMLADFKTGEPLKDKKGRNLVVVGFLPYATLFPFMYELVDEGKPFNFVENGRIATSLAHASRWNGKMRQNTKTGRWTEYH